jgi:hypothetical protein
MRLLSLAPQADTRAYAHTHTHTHIHTHKHTHIHTDVSACCSGLDAARARPEHSWNNNARMGTWTETRQQKRSAEQDKVCRRFVV